MPKAKALLGAASILAKGRQYYTMRELRGAANAKGNNSRVGKYDNSISGRAHKIFISKGTGGRERKWREKQKEGGKGDRERRDKMRNLPAWQRYISGLSLGGKQRHLIGAQHGRLQGQQKKSSYGWIREELKHINIFP